MGAGASLLVGALLADGLRVTAVDIADAALVALSGELARRPLDSRAIDDDDRPRLIVADVRTLRLDQQVDVWHDRAMFHFLIDDDDRCAYATSAAAAVRPGGHLVIATFAPDGPTSCSGLPVMRHDAASLVATFGASFELVESFEHTHITPWSADQSFTHAVLRRR